MNNRRNNNNNTSPRPTIRQQLLFTPTPPTSASKQNQHQQFNVDEAFGPIAESLGMGVFKKQQPLKGKTDSKKTQKDFVLDDAEYYDDDKYPSIPRVSSGRGFGKKESSQQQQGPSSLANKSSNVNLQLLRHQSGMNGHVLSSGNLFHNNNSKKEIPADPYNGMTRAKFNVRRWRICGKAVLAAIRLVYFGERCLGPHDKELVEAIYYKHLSSTNASSNTHLSLLLTPDLHHNHNLGNHLNNNNNNNNNLTTSTSTSSATFLPSALSSPNGVSSSPSSQALQNGRNPNNAQLYSEKGININNNISLVLFHPSSDQQNNNNNNCSPRSLMNQQINTSSIFDDLTFAEAKTLLLQKCGSNAGPIDSERKLVQFLRSEFGFVGIVEEEEQRALLKSSGDNHKSNNININNSKGIHSETGTCGTTLKQLLGYEIKTWPVRLCVLFQIVAQLTKQQEWIQQVMASKNPNLGINSVPLGNLLFDQLSVEISRDDAKSMRRKRRHEQQHQGTNNNNNGVVVAGGVLSSPANEQNTGNNNISHQWMKEHPVMLPSSSSDSSGSDDDNDRFFYHYNNNDVGNSPQQTQVTNSGTFSPSSPTTQPQQQIPEKKKPKQFKSILRRVDANFLVQILQLFQFPSDVVELFKMRASSHPWLTRKALVQILDDPLANAASVAKLSALTQSISLSAIQARRAKDRIQDASSALVSALWKKLGNHGSHNNIVPKENNNNNSNNTNSVSSEDAERAFAALFDTNNSNNSNNRNRSISTKKPANNVNSSFFGASILKSAAPGNLAGTMNHHHNNQNPKPQVAMGFSFVANIRANEESRKQSLPNQNSEFAPVTKKVDFSKTARTGKNNNSNNTNLNESKTKETHHHLVSEPSSTQKEIDQSSKGKIVVIESNTTTTSTLDRETWKKKMDSIFGDARPPPRKMMAEFRFVELSTPRRHQQQIKTTDSSETVGFTTSEQRWWLRGVSNTTFNNNNNTSDSGRNSPNSNANHQYHKNNNHLTRKDIFANYSPTKKDKSSRPTSGRLRRKSSNSVSRRESVAATLGNNNNNNNNTNAANTTSSPSYLRPTSAASSKSLPSLTNNNINNINGNSNDDNTNEKPPWHVSSGRTEGAPNPPLPLPGTPRRERDREGKKLPPPRPKWSMVNPFVDGKAWDDV